ncbi:MAG: ABC transporter ATP-binding protein/permease [Azonexus sp.]|nr:ABC transporter ATP-binding protein/permease [Azonexus sp.]MCK6411502.1 ABC transporter ATP-binding protein/permease [Azonexus sp.]
MRRSSSLPRPPAGTPLAETHAWQTIRLLLPYLWRYRLRVLAALSCLVGAKVANVGVPLIFKNMIDGLNGEQATLALPILLLLLYGAMRFSSALFTELREILFTRVTQRAVRQVALEAFRHLHALSLRFHLERQTGGVARDVERGTRSISSLMSYSLYSILPTLIEIGLVLGILVVRYDSGYALIALLSLTSYVAFTIGVSNWRIAIRRAVNETDSAANTRAVDSLLNYETVKYFNNEAWEARRYDEQLAQWESAAVRSQKSLALLNIGQQAIIAAGVTAMMWRAAAGVVAGQMSIGDLVLVNALLIQLYVPLNFLGIVYREIRQALTDIERMFLLLAEHREIADAPDARELEGQALDVEFATVDFGYEEKRRILHAVSFRIPAGRTVAVVGHSGAGKSTLARLLYRFYDVGGGCIRIGGHDIRQLRQDSLRRAIGIVPQDTVLFNDSIRYNIRYGCPEASDAEVEAVARAAQLHDFIVSLPQGYETRVGERGLKLSGGEKQRVAIARALLKNPPILIFDEATSALDSATERAIQTQLEQVAIGRTTLIVAHRLSTVMQADEILVFADGRIVERGRHADLLAAGASYASMWALQQQEQGGGKPA